MTQTFLQKNQTLTTEKINTIIKDKNTYSCFPVLFQNYVTEDKGISFKDGICIYSPGGEKYFVDNSEFDTHYSV
jgi:hypothetical protein